MFTIHVKGPNDLSLSQSVLSRALVGRDPRADLPLPARAVAQRLLTLEDRGRRIVLTLLDRNAEVTVDHIRLKGVMTLPSAATVRFAGHELRCTQPHLPEQLDFGLGEERAGPAERSRLLAELRSGTAGGTPARELYRLGRRLSDWSVALIAAARAVPQELSWHAVVYCADRLDDAALSALLEDLEPLSAWPAEVRRAPADWWGNLRHTKPEPRWRFVQKLVLGADTEDEVSLNALTSAPELQSLPWLEVDGWRWSPAQLERLSTADVLQGLTRLDLLNSKLSAVHVGRFLDGAWPENLDVLTLRGCALDDEAVQVLARHTAVGELSTLDLSNNAIGDDGARALARSAPLSRHLKVLDLQDNPLSREGIMRLRSSARLEGVQLRFGPRPSGR